jgi:hypothetical protein
LIKELFNACKLLNNLYWISDYLIK